MPSLTSTESTRDRILAAARTEFATFGIAGARIDRLAKAAKTSKERVYAHFRSKEELYRVAAATELAAAANATRLNPTDLPAYVGRMCDYFASHPECYRLMMWGRLELDIVDIPADDAIRVATAQKVQQLHEAQEAGLLDSSWDPSDVLAILDQISLAWADQSTLAPEDPALHDHRLKRRRAAAVAAAQRLFPSSVGGPSPS